MTDSYPPFLTASRVDLFLRCSASAVLAATQEESAASVAGTEAHERILRRGGLPQVVLDWFGGREPRYECAVGWDPESGRGRHLGDGIEREYGFESPYWLAGTADACSVVDGVLSVVDLKTGFGQTHGGLGPPGKSGQLRLLAWAVWQAVRLRQADHAHDGCAVHGVGDPHEAGDDLHCRCVAPEDWAPTRIRVGWFLQPEGGVPAVEDAELDPAELRAWAGKLDRRCAAVRADVPRPRPGHWCATCPCFDACPPQGQALKRLSELPGEVCCAEDAAAAHFALAAADRAVQRGRKALRAYLERQPAHSSSVSDGTELRLCTSSRRTVDARVALDSGLVPAAAAELSVTRESIARAMPGRDVDAVIDALAEVGAVTKTVTAPSVRLVRAHGAEEERQ